MFFTKQFEIKDAIEVSDYGQATVLINSSNASPIELKLLEAINEREKGNYFISKEIITNLISKQDEIKDDLLLFGLHIEHAYILWRTNNIEEAKEKLVLIENLLLSNKLNDSINQQVSTRINHIHALILWTTGDIEEAIDFQKKTAKSYLSLLQKKEAALAYNNIGRLYTEKGLFSKAFTSLQRSLEINGNRYKLDYARTLDNLSFLYRDLGEYKASINHAEQAMKIQIGLGNIYELSATLFQLVLLYNFIKDKENESKAIEQLNLLKDEDGIQIINQRQKLAKAIVLKNGLKLRDKYESLLILKEIANGHIIRSDLSILGMKFYCELLLFDLKHTGDHDILVEISNTLSQLESISEYQNSLPLKVEIKLLKSQICLLKNEFNEAKKILKDATELSVKSNFVDLAMRVSNSYDILLNEEQFWLDRARTSSIEERLERTVLDSYFQQYTISPHHRSEIDAETPIMFLILKKHGGMLVYSYKYTDDDTINEHLIGSFISAITSFSESTFRSGSLDRIKSRKYTLLIKNIDEMMYVYIFSGYSFFGLQKLEKFAQRISELSIMKDLSEKMNVSNNEFAIIDHEFMKIISTSN